jgi:transmembrane sensor
VRVRLPKTKGMLRREAAGWLARLQSGRDPDIERKFERWRGADPRHAEAFERVRRSYEQAGLLRQSPAAAAGLRPHAIRRPEWRPRPALAAAAALAVLLPVGVILLRDVSSPFHATEAVMLMTRVGEIRQVDLADGSRVTLDTATRLDVDIGQSRRSARLRYGRARLQVAPSKEPFLVETVTAAIMTRQGVIDVEQVGEEGRVEVLSGAADVHRPDRDGGAPLALGAGESAMVKPGGAVQKNAVTRGADWTAGMLQFDGTPLADAAALANRYSQRQIVLRGDVNALRVTGAFRAGDTEGLAKALAAAFHLSLRPAADGSLVLSGKDPSAP